MSKVTIPKKTGKYYVYLLIDPETKLPFYIGKGKGNRIFDHQREADRAIYHNPYKSQYIRNLNKKGLSIEYEIVFTSIHEMLCLAKEQELIAEYSKITTLTNIIHSNRRSINNFYREVKEMSEKLDTTENWIQRMHPSVFEIDSDKMIRSACRKIAEKINSDYPFLPAITIPN